jgi:hypothetical protein
LGFPLILSNSTSCFPYSQLTLSFSWVEPKNYTKPPNNHHLSIAWRLYCHNSYSGFLIMINVENVLYTLKISLNNFILSNCFSVFLVFLFYCCAGWGYTAAFIKVLTIYYTWIHPLHHSPLSLSPLIPGIVSKAVIFLFAYMCRQYLCHIRSPTTLPHLLSPSHWYQPPRYDLYCSTALRFC